MATIVEYYEVYERGFGFDDNLVARFLSTIAAEGLVKTKPNAYYVNKRPKKIVVFDSVQEFQDRHNEDLKQQALAKLSPAERIALGV